MTTENSNQQQRVSKANQPRETWRAADRARGFVRRFAPTASFLAENHPEHQLDALLRQISERN